MVYINLLPIREIKKRSQAVQQLTLFAIIFIGVLVALGAFWFFQTKVISGLKTEITALEKDKKRYEQILKQIAQLEKDKKLIESKIAVIKELQKTKAITVHVLDEVATLTPSERIWIRSLKQKGFTLNIAAMALDNQTIATYMQTLKTSEYIKDVNLVSTTLKKYAGRDLKSFSLNCSLQLPGQEDTKADTGKKQKK